MSVGTEYMQVCICTFKTCVYGHPSFNQLWAASSAKYFWQFFQEVWVCVKVWRAPLGVF